MLAALQRYHVLVLVLVDVGARPCPGPRLPRILRAVGSASRSRRTRVFLRRRAPRNWRRQCELFWLWRSRSWPSPPPPRRRPPPPRSCAPTGEAGRRGGRLVFALRSEPKTLNPVTAVDVASREVIGRLHRRPHPHRPPDPAHGPGAREVVDASPPTAGTTRWSCGAACASRTATPSTPTTSSSASSATSTSGTRRPSATCSSSGASRSSCASSTPYRVAFELEQPYAAAERLFDSMAMLPRHLLEKAQRGGPARRGLGTGHAARPRWRGWAPFRLKSYVPGERMVLERNPHYWKVDAPGSALPYLDELVFLLVPSEDAQVIRFKAGETDLITRLSAAELRRPRGRGGAGATVSQDLGAGLEYTFLFFNLNDLGAGKLPEVARKQAWFQQTRVPTGGLRRPGPRRAWCASSTRAGRPPLATHVTPGNKLWVNTALAAPAALARACPRAARRAPASRGRTAGCATPRARPWSSPSSPTPPTRTRVQMATIVQDDLRELGIAGAGGAPREPGPARPRASRPTTTTRR